MGIFTKPQNKANRDLKDSFSKFGLRQYEVATLCGYTPEYFCRLLSIELSEDRKQQILDEIRKYIQNVEEQPTGQEQRKAKVW